MPLACTRAISFIIIPLLQTDVQTARSNGADGVESRDIRCLCYRPSPTCGMAKHCLWEGMSRMTDFSSAYVRCLFCMTGKEESVAVRINEIGLGNAFHPRKIKPFFKNGKWEDRTISLLPGYVFVISEEPTPLNQFRRMQGVIRPMTYGPDDADGYLFGQDRALALWLIQENGVVGNVDVIREGGAVRIVGGLMKNFHGRILRLDRRKRLANVELEVVGSIHSIWLGVNFLEPVDQTMNDGVKIDRPICTQQNCI